jgi:hypothetical protein
MSNVNASGDGDTYSATVSSSTSIPRGPGRQASSRGGATRARDYGVLAAHLGLTLEQTVEGFLRYRAPFRHEVAMAARRRSFDSRETIDLLESADRALDQVLLATMTGHAADS